MLFSAIVLSSVILVLLIDNIFFFPFSRENELEEICKDPDMLIGQIENLESVSINHSCFLQFQIYFNSVFSEYFSIIFPWVKKLQVDRLESIKENEAIASEF